MGIKKIARPINRAKNMFVKYLKDNGATDIDEYEGELSEEWDYYRTVSGFLGENLCTAYFHIWYGDISLGFNDDTHDYKDMSIDDFVSMFV